MQNEKYFTLIVNSRKQNFFQVSASQRVCVRTKIPSLGYADTVKVVFEGGPKPLRKFAGFAK